MDYLQFLFQRGSRLDKHTVSDPSRISQLAVFERYNEYTADQYYVIDYGYSKSESYEGNGRVYEPNLVFYDVIYP